MTHVGQQQQDEVAHARLTRIDARDNLWDDCEPRVDRNVLEANVERVVDVTAGAVFEPQVQESTEIGANGKRLLFKAGYFFLQTV